LFPIDLVVTYCDGYDVEWQQDFYNYQKYELDYGFADADNQQAFNPCRIRDWGIFKHWFRCVEQNIPWINKVFLVIQRESQVPSWLNLNNPKIEVVYHKDFMPEELLPTFNSTAILYYLSNIKKLSEHFIYCPDDCFFTKYVEPTTFFTKEGKIILPHTKVPYRKLPTNTIDKEWCSVLNNDLDWEKEYFDNDSVKYQMIHFQVPRLKSFEQDFIKEHSEEILKRFSISRFRNAYNITFGTFVDGVRLKGLAVDKDNYKNSKYIGLNNFDKFKTTNFSDCDFICLNDTEYTNYGIKDDVIKKMTRHYPVKSDFELEPQEKKEEEYDYLLSIIIPVYNRKKELRKCLSTVPIHNNIEVIVVDDCSTETTVDDKLRQDYLNVKFMKTPRNIGAGGARNYGLEHCKGKYVLFLDSDDYIISTKQFSKVYSALASDYDVVFFGLEINDGSKITMKSNRNACGTLKIVKKDFIGKLRYPLIRKSEDKYFHAWLMENKPKIMYIDEILIHYDYPKNESITGKWHDTNYTNSIDNKKHYIVEATDMYQKHRVVDRVLGYIPSEGERWNISADRLAKLTWNNNFEYPFVYIIKEL